MNLKISPLALQDLKDIRNYISINLNNHAAAERILKKIIDSYSQLIDSPFIGIPLNSKISISTSYRFLICGNYLIFHKVDDNNIEIIRIIYGRRDYIKILFQNEYENLEDYSENALE